MKGSAPVVVTYLELRAPDGASAGPPAVSSAAFTLHREVAPNAAPVAFALYLRVGGPWHWTDRLAWTEVDWQQAIHRDDVELWLARIDDEVVGYFELQLDAAAVELRYFGLLPEFTGRGLGQPLLCAAVERAWALGKERVTVNTCTLDHPAALANYVKRGFSVLRTATRQQAPIT